MQVAPQDFLIDQLPDAILLDGTVRGLDFPFAIVVKPDGCLSARRFPFADELGGFEGILKPRTGRKLKKQEGGKEENARCTREKSVLLYIGGARLAARPADRKIGRASCRERV